MKYGIEQKQGKLYCANCGKIASESDELEKNYCEKCGAPLTITAIADYEETLNGAGLGVLKALKEIAVQNKTDSFLEILKQYKQDEE